MGSGSDSDDADFGEEEMKGDGQYSSDEDSRVDFCEYENVPASIAWALSSASMDGLLRLCGPDVGGGEKFPYIKALMLSLAVVNMSAKDIEALEESVSVSAEYKKLYDSYPANADEDDFEEKKDPFYTDRGIESYEQLREVLCLNSEFAKVVNAAQSDSSFRSEDDNEFVEILNSSARRLANGDEGAVDKIVKKMFFAFPIDYQSVNFNIFELAHIKAYAAGLKRRKNFKNTTAYDVAMDFLFYVRAARSVLSEEDLVERGYDDARFVKCNQSWNLRSYLFAARFLDFDVLKQILTSNVDEHKAIVAQSDQEGHDIYPGSIMDILCERKDLTLDQKFELLQLGFKQGLILQQNDEAVASLFGGLIVSRITADSAVSTLGLYKYEWENKRVDSSGVDLLLRMILKEDTRKKVKFLSEMLCAMYKKTGSIAGVPLCFVLKIVHDEVTLLAIIRALIDFLKSAKGFDAMMTVEELEALEKWVDSKGWVIEFKSLGRALQILQTPFDLDEQFDMSGRVVSTSSPLPAVGFYANDARRLPGCKSEDGATWDPGLDAPTPVRFGSGSGSAS